MHAPPRHWQPTRGELKRRRAPMHCHMDKGVTAARHRSLPAQTGLQRGLTRSQCIVAGDVLSIARQDAAWRICMLPAGVYSRINPTAPASVLSFRDVSSSARARPFAALNKVRIVPQLPCAPRLYHLTQTLCLCLSMRRPHLKCRILSSRASLFICSVAGLPLRHAVRHPLPRHSRMSQMVRDAMLLHCACLTSTLPSNALKKLH